MKTNQNLIRKMGAFEVVQRTSDGLFNANDLLQQWNKIHSRRRMDEFLNSTTTKEFIEAIRLDESERRNFAIPENQIVIKGRAKTLSNGKKVPADIWMHPLLFIDFAMWLNPTFKVQVLKFVSDQLIQYRHEAGDAYAPLCQGIASISAENEAKQNIKTVARAINMIVFNQHCTDIRNKLADTAKLQELRDLEREICNWVSLGITREFNSVLGLLRKKYQQKYLPKPF